MKIVQINTVCDHGSIAQIMLNLYNYTYFSKNSNYIAYGRGIAPSDINSYKIDNPLDIYSHIARNFILGESGFGSKHATQKLIKWLDTIKPDIIHLHNIHGFYIQIEYLFRYIKDRNISVIWTLHDCWSYTGQCAYYDIPHCTKWKTECNRCPIYRTSYPYSIFKDNSMENYYRKKASFTGVSNLTIVTPSKWLRKEVNSSFLNQYQIKVIPNGINENTFSYIDSSLSILSSRYNISNSKKIILGLANIWDSRKGLSFFLDMASDKSFSNEYQTVLIGLSKRQAKLITQKFSNDVILPLERTKDISELCMFYSIATAFINPTLEDNFPTTNLEALSCGTPVITFDSGGSSECIDSTCGISIPKGDILMLKKAIKDIRTIDRSHCRERVLKYYTSSNMCQSYSKLYEQVLSYQHYF